MAIMGLLGDFIQQNPNMFNQMQPPVPDARAGNPINGGLIPLLDLSQGMNKPRRPDPFGNILPDQGFPPPLNSIQDQMFRPPMQQPVQNQMPVANSFLDQLQQSTQSLNNQIRNVVPQNRFVGNQFQMPFNFGGGGNFGNGGFNQNTGFNLPYNPSVYNPGNFNYTPGAFNQYGNIPVTDNIPSNVATSMQDRGSNESDRRQLERSKGRYSYETFNGKSYRVDNQTGQVEEGDAPFSTASVIGNFFNQIPGVEDSRFKNLPLNTQEQINNLVANDPNSLRNAQGINKAVRDVFGVDLNSNLTNEFNQAQGLTTPAGLLNRPVNLNITPQDLSLLGGIPTTATERLNITEAEKIAANQRLAQRLTQAQQINEAIKAQNPVLRMSSDDFGDALNRMTDEQFKSFNRTDAERGITTARSDPSRSRQNTAKGRAESRAGTNKARDDASRSTGVGRGFMGGR